MNLGLPAFGGADPFIALLRLPARQHLRFAAGEIAAHRERRVGKIQSGFVIGHIKEPLIKSRMAAHSALRGRRHDTVGVSLWRGNAAYAPPPAIGRSAVTCRRGYMQERPTPHF